MDAKLIGKKNDTRPEKPSTDGRPGFLAPNCGRVVVPGPMSPSPGAATNIVKPKPSSSGKK